MKNYNQKKKKEEEEEEEVGFRNLVGDTLNGREQSFGVPLV